MCFKFAKQCLKIEKMKVLFPRDIVQPKTSRYQFSAISVMQKMLNNAEREKRQVLRKINSFVPVNHDCSLSLSLR